jgi:type I restriction enzyme S subunit
MAGRKLTQALENHARLQASPLSEELPPGYKMTELGPLPEEWRVVRLGEVFSLVPKQQRAVRIQENQNYRLLTVRLYAKGIVLRSEEQGSRIGTKVLYKTEPQDFIFSKIDARNGAWGFVCPDLAGGLISGDFPILRHAHEKADQAFLEFLLSRPSMWEPLRNMAVGTTNRRRIQPKQLLSLLIPLPPLLEQRAIADVLRTVQRAKEATERVIAALRELKKSLMRYLFTYGPVPVDQADQVALKETEIGPVPEEWEVVRLGDLVNQGILWMKNGFPQGKHNQSGKGIIHLRPFNINEDGYIDISQKKFVDPPQKGQYWVLPGDVIFNNTNSEELVGKTAYFDLHGNFVISNHMTIIRVVRTEIIETYYLAKYLHQLWRQGLFRKMCRRHVNQASVSLERLKRLSVPLPPLSEQRAIAEILRAVDRKIEAEEARQRALEALFRTLLHDLMTARRRLPAEFISRFAEETDHE